jgi:apolipoprotein N-acyltransferase
VKTEELFRNGLALLVGSVCGRCISIDAGIIIIPLGLTVLFALLQQSSERMRLRRVFFWFFGCLFFSLSWMIWGLVAPDQSSLLFAILLMCVLFSLHSLVYVGVFWLIGIIFNPLIRRYGLRRVESVASSFHGMDVGLALRLGFTVLISEFIRSYTEIGIPWGLLGYSQVDNPLFHGAFAIVGVYGVSALTVLLVGFCMLSLGGISYLLSLRRQESVEFNVVGMSFVPLFCIIVILGSTQSMRWTQAAGEPIAARVVHTHMLDELKYEPASQLVSQSTLLELAGKKDVAFTLYPELYLTAPAYAYKKEWRGHLVALIEASGNAQLIGMPDAVVTDAGGFLGLSNALVQIDAKGGFSRQVKEKLIPFAETELRNPLLYKISRWFSSYPNSNFISGPMHHDNSPKAHLSVDGIALSASLCSEIASPFLIQSRSFGRQILVNSSSESWIVSDVLNGLVLKALKARVLESQKPLLRASNVGFSGLIDVDGAFQETLDLTGVFLVQPYVGETPVVRFSHRLIRYLS